MASPWSRAGRSVRAAWTRTARLRAGASAAARAGLITAEAARSMATAPPPPVPDTARTTEASQSRVIPEAERLGARQLGDYGRRDLGARAETTGRDIAHPPPAPLASERRPAAERTARALGRDVPPAGGSAGRQGPATPGRGR